MNDNNLSSALLPSIGVFLIDHIAPDPRPAGIVFDLIGSIGSATLNFTLPGIFFFFMFRGDANALYRGVAIFLAVFGACFSVLGTWLTFV